MNGELAYIGLGANLGEPKRQIHWAIEQLATIALSRVVAVSKLYRSAPMGPQDQPAYINAVAALQTSLSPLALLDQLQAIENAAGRVRGIERWGPRTLDLDIIMYGSIQLSEERLTLPHYGAKDRNFVLLPLYEIAPELQFPDGESVAERLQQIGTDGIKPLS